MGIAPRDQQPDETKHVVYQQKLPASLAYAENCCALTPRLIAAFGPIGKKVVFFDMESPEEKPITITDADYCCVSRDREYAAVLSKENLRIWRLKNVVTLADLKNAEEKIREFSEPLRRGSFTRTLFFVGENNSHLVCLQKHESTFQVIIIQVKTGQWKEVKLGDVNFLCPYGTDKVMSAQGVKGLFVHDIASRGDEIDILESRTAWKTMGDSIFDFCTISADGQCVAAVTHRQHQKHLSVLTCWDKTWPDGVIPSMFASKSLDPFFTCDNFLVFQDTERGTKTIIYNDLKKLYKSSRSTSFGCCELPNGNVFESQAGEFQIIRSSKLQAIYHRALAELIQAGSLFDVTALTRDPIGLTREYAAPDSGFFSRFRDVHITQSDPILAAFKGILEKLLKQPELGDADRMAIGLLKDHQGTLSDRANRARDVKNASGAFKEFLLDVEGVFSAPRPTNKAGL